MAETKKQIVAAVNRNRTEIIAILNQILERTGLQVVRSGRASVSLNTQPIVDAIQSVVDKLITGPSTEAKQDTLIAKIIAAPATEAKQDAMESTLDAILFQQTPNAATEALQNDMESSLNTLIAANATNFGLLTAGIVVDAAATVLILLDIIVRAASDATRNSRLNDIKTATESTLAKIIAAPATESKQDDMEASLNSVVTNSSNTAARLITGGNSAAVLLDAIADDSLGHQGDVTTSLSISIGDNTIQFRPSINEAEQTIGILELTNGSSVSARTWDWNRVGGQSMSAVTETGLSQISVAASTTARFFINARVQRDNYLTLVRTSTGEEDTSRTSWQGERGSGTLSITSPT